MSGLANELADILFGGGIYNRPGAPEPDLLIDLLPLLPEPFLDDAFYLLRDLLPLGSLARGHALLRILRRSDPETRMRRSRTLVWGQELFWLLRPTDAGLIVDLLGDIRDNIAAPFPRRYLFEAIIRQIPFFQLEDDLLSILYDIASSNPFDNPDRDEDISALITLMCKGPVSARVLVQLVEVARSIRSDAERGGALIVLAWYTDHWNAIPLVDEGLAVLTGIHNNAERVTAIARVLSFLPEEAFRNLYADLLSVATSIPFVGARLVALASLRAALPEMREEIAGHILSIPAVMIWRERFTMSELVQVLPHLSHIQAVGLLDNSLAVIADPELAVVTFGELLSPDLLSEFLFMIAYSDLYADDTKIRAIIAGARYVRVIQWEGLAAAADRLGSFWKERAFGMIRAIAEEGHGPGWNKFHSPAQIQQMYRELNAQEQYRLASRLLYTLRQRHIRDVGKPVDRNFWGMGGSAGYGSQGNYASYGGSQGGYSGYGRDSGYGSYASWSPQAYQERPDENSAEGASPSLVPDPAPQGGREPDLQFFDESASGASTDSSPDAGRSSSIVNTGFAEMSRPAEPVDPSTPLVCGEKYYFWFEVGERVRGAIDVEPVSIPVEILPKDAVLTVALFGFDGEIGIIPGSEIGTIAVREHGRAIVHKQAASPDLLPDSPVNMYRLFFPVTIPRQSGTFKLRCDVYYEQVLLQSYLVAARAVIAADAMELPEDHGAGLALRTTSDYTISRSLSPLHLASLGAHRLSIMLNDNGNGTHGFRFFGDDGTELVKQDAVLTEAEIQNLIRMVREELRLATWGTTGEWKESDSYLYGNDGSSDTPDLERLRKDLVGFAKCGWRIYDSMVERIAVPHAASAQEARNRRAAFKEMMKKPGLVQIATKESIRHVIPFAMFYDYPLDTGFASGNYKLCPSFLEAFGDGVPLKDTLCFKGECPSQDLFTVCPGGFWGFRHGIGFPMSVPTSDSDTALTIHHEGTPRIAVSVSMELSVTMRANHEKAIEKLFAHGNYLYAQSRRDTLELMLRGKPHILYFYCHGAVSNHVPYIQIGPPGDPIIDRSILRANDIRWDNPRPLVFINGCHTTALEPEMAFELVSGFIGTSNAAGVIGTEITIFEPLACSFGEEFIRLFLEGESVGESVRLARLNLLQKGNPLGLVYIPFVLASLSMEP